MEIIALFAAVAVGYVGAIWTWDKVKLAINGAEAEATRLRIKAQDIEAAVRAKL